MRSLPCVLPPHIERGGNTQGNDLTAAHLTYWIRENSWDSRLSVLLATTIAYLHPLEPHGPHVRVPFFYSANIINMVQVGMFRNEDNTLRLPQWNCTLSGAPLLPELDRSEPEAGLPQIFTPWSDNETLLMHRLFPNPDSLCLNFGRTGVLQWNHPNSSEAPTSCGTPPPDR